MMKILFIGCGDLAGHVLHQMSAKINITGAEIYGLRRTISKLPKTAFPIIPLAMDLTDEDALAPLKLIAFDIVIVSLSPDDRSQIGYERTYVHGLKNILAVFADHPIPPKHLIWISSTSVYGDMQHGLLDETSIPVPTNYRGEVLLKAEALLQTCHFPTTILRLTGIYGLNRMSLLTRARIPEKKRDMQMSNRIHIEDAAGFMAHLIDLIEQSKTLRPLYLVTDDAPTPYCEVIDWLQLKMGISTEVLQEPTKHTHLNLSSPLDKKSARYFSNNLAKSTGWYLSHPSFKEGFDVYFSQ